MREEDYDWSDFDLLRWMILGVMDADRFRKSNSTWIFVVWNSSTWWLGIFILWAYGNAGKLTKHIRETIFSHVCCRIKPKIWVNETPLDQSGVSTIAEFYEIIQI